MTVVLETRNLRKTFGGITATDNVTFKLQAGARHALIGPNGAGKTTFVNQLSGVLLPTSGTVLLLGQDVTNWSVRKRTIAGLARTFQINQLFADLTPLQTMVLAIAEREKAGAQWFRPVGSRTEFVDEAVELTGGRAAIDDGPRPAPGDRLVGRRGRVWHCVLRSGHPRRPV